MLVYLVKPQPPYNVQFYFYYILLWLCVVSLSIEEPKPSASSQRVVRPVCQIARAQAPIQAALRPAMWVPGLRNLHMARETWVIKMALDQALDKLVAAVEGIDKAELMEVHKVHTPWSVLLLQVFIAMH